MQYLYSFINLTSYIVKYKLEYSRTLKILFRWREEQDTCIKVDALLC